MTRYTGIVIPLFSVRGAMGPGPDFLDLCDFGDLCKNSGLNMIQLLPVYDTGASNSPYDLLSSFALHPIYIRLQEVAGCETYHKEVAEFSKQYATEKKVNYDRLLSFKMSILRKVYRDYLKSGNEDAKLNTWVKKNKWVKSYAVFRYHYDRAEYDPKKLEKIHFKIPEYGRRKQLWKESKVEMMFYAWIQFHLSKQFQYVRSYLDKLDVKIKGDLPFLLNRQSVDVWQYPKLFDLSGQVGAPPDAFSLKGQNWRFPSLTDEGRVVKWWQRRLQYSRRFFSAIRIDHVLGLFRLWFIPPENESGRLGYYQPNVAITRNELHAAGFSDKEILELANPEIEPQLYWKIRSKTKKPEVMPLIFKETKNGYRFRFKTRNETSIAKLKLPVEPATELEQNLFDTVLLRTSRNEYLTNWHWQRASYLREIKKKKLKKLHKLISKKEKAATKIWQVRGMKILKKLKQATDQIICAEDLGVVPAYVPATLKSLGIYPLWVWRWSAERLGSPDLPSPAEFPNLAVAVPSTHDTTTARAWFEEEAGDAKVVIKDSGGYWRSFFSTKADICLAPLQDLFWDTEFAAKNSSDERINVPGTLPSKNWLYRFPAKATEISRNRPFMEKLSAYAELHKSSG